MSVVENLLFGTPVGPELQPDRIARNPYLLKVLADAGLTETLADVGRRIAETMVELFADLPPGHPFFEQFSFISAEDLPEYRALLGRLGKASVATLPAEDRNRLTSLAFPYVEARHRLGLIDAELEARLLEARARLRPRPAGGAEVGGRVLRQRQIHRVPPRCRTTCCSAAWSTARPRRPRASAS